MSGGGREEEPRTTPSEAVGESGDAQARREAEEAMLGPRRAAHTDQDHDREESGGTDADGADGRRPTQRD
ncbi:hypothetical protein ACFZCF_15375 [Streptomyces sp. NPDC007945]|uniref:hypothetical protein n=1 Tax=Streptomyces sp. NPDC007945 TaxID=3364797 RepID=UPI0036E3C302